MFYSRPLERGCLLRYSTGDSPATPHSDHSTGPETAGSRNIPSIGGWIFPRLEDGYSLDWRMDIPSIGGWIFPRLEDGYSLDWRMDIPSIGGWIIPRLEDGQFGRAFGKPGRGTRILLTTVKRSKNSKG